MFQFFKSKPFALYINDGFVQAMQLKGDTASAKLQAIGYQDLLPGVVVGGQIMKPDVLKTEIFDLFKKTQPNPVSGNECVVTLPEAQTYEGIFYLHEKLEGDALRTWIETKISSSIPIPFQELTYDAAIYTLKNVQIVFTLAVRKSVLSVYDDFLRKDCHLKPLAFEPESFSLMRTFRMCFEPNHPQILLYVRQKTLNWFLFLNGIVFDSSVGSLENIDDLAHDLQKSMTFFHEQSDEQVQNIFVTGFQKGIDVLLQMLPALLKIPLKRCEHYSIDLKDFDLKKINVDKEDLLGGSFSIVTGTALKTIGIDLGIRIRLSNK